MGLLTGLLTAPLAPVRMVTWVAERVLDNAEAQYYDPAPVYAALAELEHRLERGEIDEAAFEREEDALLDRLDEISRFRQGRGG
ncbi:MULTISPECIES: gas vesicle protein GvpG [Streptomyces]|uniref:Gas vesicle protein n=1 Tax=Streptomyces hydrogenans TaxID=1873719 RepID=A0ABQ3PRM2_9ACTN|nr:MULTISPECIES: gas vesicle protein GvpG [Streptomyces]MCM1948390.1 gas vesicle protein GvpG [Streptomyces sp. G2]GHG34810.1 gas vesicle protein [Streptomyces hydrogenans]GHI27673.1 gas vesicle protein [Streptomyces hydrogenans]